MELGSLSRDVSPQGPVKSGVVSSHFHAAQYGNARTNGAACPRGCWNHDANVPGFTPPILWDRHAQSRAHCGARSLFAPGFHTRLESICPCPSTGRASQFSSVQEKPWLHRLAFGICQYQSIQPRLSRCNRSTGRSHLRLVFAPRLSRDRVPPSVLVGLDVAQVSHEVEDVVLGE